MSLSTSYRLYIQPTLDSNGALPWYKEWNSDKRWIELFCDEAQLPNVQAQTGLMTNRHLGEGPFQYPHTRIYSDVTLGFLCDANMTPLKFFTAWHNFIFGGKGNEFAPTQIQPTLNNFEQGAADPAGAPVRLQFPSEYAGIVRIIKTETGVNADRPSIGYNLIDAYPYSIDSVPLAYGGSQLTKVTVNLHYKKHTIFTAQQN